MKQKYEIIIDASCERVWAAFDDHENRVRWQRNFCCCRQISGQPRLPGAVAELVFDERGKRVVLTETITERRDGSFLAAIYESAQGATIMVNHFDSIDENSTRWSSWCNFRFNGMMKFMSLFAGSRIRARMEDDMARFRLMIETDEANRKS